MTILQRYVLAELLRVFSLLVVGLTVLLVFVGVVDQATRNGLGPMQIVQILPYIVPSLLPFTIPATLLLTVCVVYGRMSGDQEITATKAAGINVMVVLWPSFFLGGVLSLCTLLLTDQFIPWAQANINRIITLAMEDIFLDMLRAKNQVTDNAHGIAITVIRVDGKKLIMPTFRYKPQGENTVTIQAQEATLKFDVQKQQVMLYLYRGHIETPGAGTIWFEREVRPFPLPMHIEPPHVRNITIQNIRKELKEIKHNRADLDQQQLISTAFSLTLGDFDRLSANDYIIYKDKTRQQNLRFFRLDTEQNTRMALACSCFFFVLVGSPFSIMQARRQFLTNFFICFTPVLIVYYPIVMLTKTLGMSDMLRPTWGMWIANCVLLFAGVVILRKVLKH